MTTPMHVNMGIAGHNDTVRLDMPLATQAVRRPFLKLIQTKNMNSKILLPFYALWVCVNGLLAQSPVWVQKAHPEGLQVNGAIFSPDGQSVLSGTNCHPAKIRRFNVSDGTMTWDYTVSATLECMMGVALSSNNQYFASAEETGHLMLFDYTQNPPTLAQTIDLNTSYAFAVGFAPNTTQVVVGCSNGKLKAYDLPAGTEAWSITAHTNWVTSVDYSPDNSMIATGGSDNKVKIWNTAGMLLKTLNGHTEDITSVKFTPDNQKLLSSSQDKKLRIWDVNTGNLLQTITVSTNIVNALDISPDGQYAVTASDTLLRIWSLSDFSQVGSFSTSDWDTPMAVSWSPVNNLIVCGTSNGSVLLFDAASSVGTHDLPDLAAKVYPNPCTNQLTIEWPVNESVIQAFLYDLNGCLLLQKDNLVNQPSIQIQVQNQTPGSILMLKLVSSDGRTYEHLIQKL
jgi:WD40 repeat protein